MKFSIQQRSEAFSQSVKLEEMVLPSYLFYIEVEEVRQDSALYPTARRQGKFQENVGHDEHLEMYGLARATVTADLKIQKIEVFFDPETFIKACEGRLKPTELKGGRSLIGDVECPYAGKSLKIRI